MASPNPPISRRNLKANREIAPGEELVDCYLATGASNDRALLAATDQEDGKKRADRCALLRARWRFDCRCSICRAA